MHCRWGKRTEYFPSQNTEERLTCRWGKRTKRQKTPLQVYILKQSEKILPKKETDQIWKDYIMVI